MAAVYSGRVRICQPPAASTISMPWPPSSYCARSSMSAASTDSGVASGSSAASASALTGIPLAKSAASSSCASGVIGSGRIEWRQGGSANGIRIAGERLRAGFEADDLERAERQRLAEDAFAEAGELENREQNGEDLPRLGPRAYQIPPADPSPAGEERAGRGQCARHVKGTRYDRVDVRAARRPEQPVDRGQQVGHRGREGARWREALRRGRRGPGEPISPALRTPLEDIHHFADLLVFEQATDQLRARIVPGLCAFMPRQKHLRLDAQQ